MVLHDKLVSHSRACVRTYYQGAHKETGGTKHVPDQWSLEKAQLARGR